MRNLFTLLLLLLSAGLAQAQGVPELIYYKFSGSGATVVNEASAPVGTNPASLVGLTQGPGGQFGNGLLGTGVTNDWVDTGWPINLGTGSWTISMYLSGIQSLASPLHYFFGETSAPSSFRCFTGGAAGAGNLLLRSPNGTANDVLLNGVFNGSPVVITYVFNSVTSDIRAYVNGVLTLTVPQSTVVPFVSTGTLKVGGYSGTAAIPTGGVMDEFRLYNRALTALEVDQVWDQTLPFAQSPVDVALTTLVAPNYANGGCFSANQTIEVTIANQGTDTLNFAVTPLIVTSQVTGPNPQTYVDTINSGILPPAASLNQVMTTSYNMTGSGLFNFLNYIALVTPGADSNGVNDTLSVALQPGLNGTYTVNSALPTAGTNFQSFTELASALNTAGMCGPVVVNVAPNSGPYNGQFALNQIAGSSAANTLTINGNGNTLQHLSTNTNSRATLLLNGTDYVTVDSLNIISLGQSTTEYGWAVHLTNNADFNTFNACQFIVTENSTSTNYAPFVTSSSSTGATTSGAAASNLTVTNCLAEGGYYGMVINGATTAPFSSNNLISGNVIRDFYLYGLYLRGQNNSTFSGNEIYRDNRGTISTTYMIYITSDMTGSVITRNNMHDMAGVSSTTSTAYGIYGTGVNANGGQELLISNNLISGFDGMDGAQYGMYLLTTNGARLLHNSVSMDYVNHPGSSIIRALHHSGAGAFIELRNNIFSVTTNSTGAKHVLYFATNTAAIGSNFNILHMGATAGTNSIAFLGTSFTTLADWQVNLQDPGSLSINPGFVNSIAGDLTPTSVGLNNVFPAEPLVPVDFFGISRGANVDPGAIEFTPAANDLGVLDILSPVSPACSFTATEPVTFRFINRGFSPVNLNQIQARVTATGPVNSGPFTEVLPVGVLAGGDTFTYTFTNTLNLSTNGNYQVVVQVSFTPASGLVDGNPADNTDTLQLLPGIAGAYTINAALPTGGTNFASFNAMVSTFTASGICGPVTVTVAPNSGPYTEQVTIGAISGMSAVNTLTILGNGNTLKFLSTNNSARHTLELDGATYVTVDSLVIVSEGQTTSEYGWAVWLTNNADFNTFNACRFQVAENSTSLNYAAFVTSSSATSATTSGAAASNLTVTNCVVDGGYYGMVINGPTTAPFSSNNVISGNIIRDFALYGMYLRGQNNSTYADNDIFRDDRTTISTTYMIYITSDMTGTLITRNRMHDFAGNAATTTSTAYGIYGTGVVATAGQELLISNNVISGFDGMNGTQYGMYLLTTNGAKVYHNSVSMDHVNHPGASIVRAFHHSGATSVIDVQNNIFSVTTNSTGTKHVLYFATNTALITSNYNVLHMGATLGTNDLAFLNTTFPTLAAWQAGGTYDVNSVGFDPIFGNSLAGNLTPTSASVNDIVPPLALVPTDLFGVSRGLTPDPGAIEFAPLGSDAGVESINNLLSGCGLSSSTPISVTVRNFGLDTLFTFQVSYQLNGVTVTETVNTVLLSGASFNYTFTTPADLGTEDSTYVFNAWTSAAGDVNTFNDSTLGVSITHYPSISALPYVQNFDSWTVSTGTSPGAPVISLPDNWINIQGDGNQDWAVRSGTTSTANTGPNGDHTTGTGNYLYVEDTGFANDSVLLVSPCFDVSGYGATLFSFWYHSNNGTQPTNENFLHVDLLWNGQLVPNVIAPIGHKGNSWNLVEINMTPYPGTFAVRFRVDNSTGGTHDIAIDDIGLRELPPVDVGVASLLSPQTGCGLSNAEQIIFAVENFGTDTLRTPVQVVYQITGPLTLTGSVTMNDTLGSADQAVVTLPGTYNFSVPGTYTIVAWTQGLAGDANSANDTLFSQVISIPEVTTFPYTQDFESGNGGWLAGSPNGISSWALGTPSQTVINSAASGVNAWMTGLSSNHFDNEQSFVISPCFDFTNLSLPSLSMSVWWNSVVNSDGAQVQASTNGGLTWTTVGTTGLPDNWYTSTNIAALAWAGGTNEGWSGRNSTGNGSNGWVTAKVRMPALAGQSNVRLRVVFASSTATNDEGFAFDDVRIFDVPNNDAALAGIIDPGITACTDDSIRIEVALKNEGLAAQAAVPVTVTISGPSPSVVTGTYTGAFPPDTTVTFVVGYFNAPTAGIYTLSASTGLPGDTLTVNNIRTRQVDVRQTPALPTVFSDSLCPTDSAQFTLIASTTASNLIWYDAPTGGAQVFVGDTLITPFLTQTTTYWVEATNKQPYLVGPATNGIGAGGNFTNAGVQGMFFTAISELVIDSVTVYPQTAGNVVIRLRDAANTTTLATVTVPVTVGGLQPVRIPVGLVVQPGSYRIDGDGSTTGGLYRNTAGAVYPYQVPGVISITGNTFDPAYYYYFYNWQVSGVGCASGRVPVTATFFSPISVDLGADAVVCPGFVLDATTPGAASYVWNNDPSVNTATVRVDTAGTYNVFVQDVNGCSAADTISVALLPGPIVDLGADVTACNEALLDAGNPGSLYNWSVPGQSGQTLTVTSSGVYFVSVEASGCVNTDTVVVTILSGPDVDFGADQTSCLDVTLDAGNPGSTYLWSTGATTRTIVVTPPALVSVEVSSANGCTDTDSIQVSVGADPVVDLGLNQTVCDSLTLNAGNAGATYLWSTGATSQRIIATQSGTYSVQVVDAIGCAGTDSVTLVVNLSPEAAFTETFVTGFTYNFTSTSTGGGSFIWDFGDGSPTVNQQNPSHTYPFGGSYQVTLVVTNECGTDTFTKVLGNVSLFDENFARMLSAYPNPTDGVFVVRAEGLFADQVTFEVVDVRGRTVITQSTGAITGNLEVSIDLSAQAEGPYVLKVSDGVRQAFLRIVRL